MKRTAWKHWKARHQKHVAQQNLGVVAKWSRHGDSCVEVQSLSLCAISADPSARGSAPGSYDAKCVLTEPATCGFAWFGHETCWGSRSAKGFGSPFSYIVRGRRFAWFRHESCCCSAVSQAVRQRLGTLVFAICVVAVSHGLGTNPAAVRRFRKRSAKGLGR